MVNVIIYLTREFAAGELVKLLLSKKLIASASIDFDNHSFKIIDGEFSEIIFNVVTAQSRATLFKEIVHVVEETIGKNVIINSTPIVGSNKSFDEWVMTNTLAPKI